MTNNTDQVCLSQHEIHVTHNTLYKLFFFLNCCENRVHLQFSPPQDQKVSIQERCLLMGG